MRLTSRTALLGTVLAAACVALAARQPAPVQRAAAQKAAAPATGFILGRVVDAGTMDGIPGAVVTLVGAARGGGPGGTPARPVVLNGQPTGPGTLRVVSGADGRFLFRDLPAGSYSISVGLTGYSPGAYGRLTVSGPPQSLVLADNEKRSDVVVRLWKLAAITGTVRDEAGEPMVGMTVRAFRRTWANGRVRLSPGITALTDDRGVYRLSGLSAGDYVVSVPMTTVTIPVSASDPHVAPADSQTAAAAARARMETGAPSSQGGLRVGNHTVGSPPSRGGTVLPMAGDGGALFVYPTRYFSSGAMASQAETITLDSGTERTGVDFAMQPVPSTRITGVLTGPDGPAAGYGVRLLPADVDSFAADTGMEVASALTDAAGQFVFLGVTAGQYRLSARRQPRPDLPMVVRPDAGAMAPVTISVAPAAPTDLFWADAPVSVGDAPVDGVSLMLRPGLHLSGRVEFQGALPRPTPRQMQSMSVTLASLDGASAFNARQSITDPQGQFRTMGVAPGRYMLTVSPPGAGWFLTSLMAGATDLLAEPARLESNDIANVVAVFSDRMTELSGSVQGLPARPDAVAMIVLFPADYQRWLADGAFPRRTMTTRSGPAGAFQMRLQAPGAYLIAAIPLEDYSGQQTPEFYAALARIATSVSIVEGERRTITVPVSRMR